MSIYNARDLAIAWLSVSTASATNRFSPALNRTVLIEQFRTGVRLVATDSFTLLTSWCPGVDHPEHPEPDLDLAPDLVAVAMDGDGRAGR